MRHHTLLSGGNGRRVSVKIRKFVKMIFHSRQIKSVPKCAEFELGERFVCLSLRACCHALSFIAPIYSFLFNCAEYFI